MNEKMKREGQLDVRVKRYDAEKGYADWENICTNHNIITKAGIDVASRQVYAAAWTTTSASAVALTCDTTAPTSTDTAMTNELTTGGMSRAVGTYAHTASQATLTLTKTFTATAQFTAIVKSGIFDTNSAPTSGNLVHEATFSSTNLNTNDALQITWTITLS